MRKLMQAGLLGVCCAALAMPAIAGETKASSTDAVVAQHIQNGKSKLRLRGTYGQWTKQMETSRTEFVAAMKAIPAFDYQHIPANYLEAYAWYDLLNHIQQTRFPKKGVKADTQTWMQEDGLVNAVPVRPSTCGAGLQRVGQEPGEENIQVPGYYNFTNVLVMYDVANDGSATNIRVAGTTSYRRLKHQGVSRNETAATRTVAEWKFPDAANTPVACRTNLIATIHPVSTGPGPSGEKHMMPRRSYSVGRGS